MSALELDGAVVAITGAGRGIGRATAQAFAAAGARACLGDLDGELAEAAAAELGDEARGFAVDVASRESFAAFLATVERETGPPDVLVNNAGIMPLGRFLDEDEATSRATIEVNLWGSSPGSRSAADCRRSTPRTSPRRSWARARAATPRSTCPAGSPATTRR